jgi:outer membrane protein insertion porin family
VTRPNNHLPTSPLPALLALALCSAPAAVAVAVAVMPAVALAAVVPVLPPPVGDPRAAPAAADGPAAPPPADGTAPPAEDEPPLADAASPEAAPVTAPLIAGFEIGGTLTDPADKIQTVLRGLFPEGTRFVESGPADRVGTPIGSLPRARRALENVGYDAVVDVKPARDGRGVVLAVHLRPYDRLRYIFVHGNWPALLQDEIQRRITFRPGRTLPLPGPERDAAIERERERVIQFARSKGYFDANVRIDLEPHGSTPAAVDFHVRISLGDAYPVGPVVISGNSVIPSSDIDPMFRHSRWLWIRPKPFELQQMRDDIAKVTERFRDAGYPGARVSTSYDPEHSIDRKNKNVGLAITINERKRVYLSFEGNRNRSDSALEEQLTLKERGAYDDYEAGASADALRRHYQERGFFFARVLWRRERISATANRLVFVIDEGPQLKVRGVDFVGNKARPASELAEVVTVRTFPLLGYIGLGEGGFVTPLQIEFDAQRLKAHYLSKGFPEAVVHGEASTTRETLGMIGAVAAGAETVARDARAIYVRYTIEEGPLVRVAAEDFKADGDGHIPFHPTFMRDSLSLRPGEPYMPQLLREDGRRLERMMGDAGYVTASADYDIEKRDDGHVAILWKLKLGPRIRVGPIFVRGNFITKANTILRQIPIKSGDYLTTTAFERGQRNLQFLQLFNNAAPITFPGKDEGQTVVPMVVEVEERHAQYNVLHLGLGASTEQAPLDGSLPIGAYARVGYDHRNLFGRGWTIGAALNYGLFSAPLVRATTNFLNNRFLGTLFKFDIAGQYYRQATVRLGDIHSWGGSIGFSREMYPGVDAGIHYNLRNTTYTEPLLRMPGANEMDRSITLGTTVGSLLFDVKWLRLDNRLVPARGFKIEGLVEVAPRSLSFGYAQASFVKTSVRSTVVIPLTSWLSLRHGLRYDQGIPLGDEPLLPKVERYFAGGDTTIRGFRLDRARVSEVYYPFSDGTEEVQYRPIGGNLRVLQNIDLQFPIAPPLYGSVFIDNGVVADSFDGMRAGDFRHGVGIAPIQLKLPIGDLSFAWAWPLDPRPGDTKIGVLHVNIGLMF